MDSIFDDPPSNEYNPAPTFSVSGIDAPLSPQADNSRPSRSSRVKLIVKRNVDDAEDDNMSLPPRTTRQSSHVDIGPARTLRSRSGHASGSPDSLQQSQGTRLTRSGRPVASYQESSAGEDEQGPIAAGTRRTAKRSTRSNAAHGLQGLIASDEDEALESDDEYGARRSQRKAQPPPPRAKKSPRKRRRVVDDEDDDFNASDIASSRSSEDGFEEANLTSPSPEPERPKRASRAHDSPEGPRGYSFRPQKRPINYEIPPPLDNDAILASIDAHEKGSRPARPRAGFSRGIGAAGSSLLDSIPLPAPPPINDDSDSDDPNHPNNKPSTSAGNVHGGQGLIGAGGATNNDIATAAGGPANFGKVSKDSRMCLPSILCYS